MWIPGGICGMSQFKRSQSTLAHACLIGNVGQRNERSVTNLSHRPSGSSYADA